MDMIVWFICSFTGSGWFCLYLLVRFYPYPGSHRFVCCFPAVAVFALFTRSLVPVVTTFCLLARPQRCGILHGYLLFPTPRYGSTFAPLILVYWRCLPPPGSRVPLAPVYCWLVWLVITGSFIWLFPVLFGCTPRCCYGYLFGYFSLTHYVLYARALLVDLRCWFVPFIYLVCRAGSRLALHLFTFCGWFIVIVVIGFVPVIGWLVHWFPFRLLFYCVVLPPYFFLYLLRARAVWFIYLFYFTFVVYLLPPFTYRFGYWLLYCCQRITAPFVTLLFLPPLHALYTLYLVAVQLCRYCAVTLCHLPCRPGLPPHCCLFKDDLRWVGFGVWDIWVGQILTVGQWEETLGVGMVLEKGQGVRWQTGQAGVGWMLWDSLLYTA